MNPISSNIDASALDVPDQLILLKHLLKGKFGLNSDLTLRQQQNRFKSDSFNMSQQNSLEFIHRSAVILLGGSESVSKLSDIPSGIVLNSLRPNLHWDVDKCQRLSDQILKSVSSSQDESKGDSNVYQSHDGDCDGDDKESLTDTVLVDDEEKIELTKPQEKVVADLKAAIEEGQLLGFLQGFPGAGKTTTSKKMADVTGLRVLFCGSTGTASAQFYSRTINSLLSLGLSVDNIDLSTASTSAHLVSKVVAAVENYDLILIDEASMVTPVTLARIDLRLRHCFNSELPFGGKHILLCGDMWQFPPVSHLRKSALYQAAVAVATNKKVPNEAYRAGANLFTQFKLFILNDQQRLEKDYADFLAPLSDTSIKYPVTRDWLNKLKILGPDDVKNPSSAWQFATVAVTGNVERLIISKFKARLFGEKYNEPILTWVCPVRSGGRGRSIKYDPLDVDEETLTGKYAVLNKYFVRGAPCVLSENLATEKGLAKGTKGTLEGLVWSSKDCKGAVPNMDILERGKVHVVPQPTFILVRFKNKHIDRIVPIRYTNAKLELDVRNEEIINYREHPVDLLFAVTYHKLQGLTLKALVLSLNTHPTHKLRITIPSLYVGLSRVHNFDEIRVLPFWEDDVKHLTSLKSDPLLRLWFNNYTQDGVWKHDGLRSFTAALRKQTVMSLALVDELNMLTAEEARKFAKELDIYVGKLTKPGLISKLQPYWTEGRRYLSENGGVFLVTQRRGILDKLRKLGNLGNLKIQVLKHYSKRLGINVLEVRGRKNLELALSKLLGTRLETCFVQKEDNAARDVKQSVDGKQPMACQSVNNSDQAFAFPSSSSCTLSVQQPSLVSSGDALNSQPGELCKGVQSKFSKEFTINFTTQLKHCLSKHFDHGLHVVKTVTMPNGIQYDRIYNVGAGDCFFLSIAQGCRFFGVHIDHIELRSRVGQ